MELRGDSKLLQLENQRKGRGGKEGGGGHLASGLRSRQRSYQGAVGRVESVHSQLG